MENRGSPEENRRVTHSEVKKKCVCVGEYGKLIIRENVMLPNELHRGAGSCWPNHDDSASIEKPNQCLM